MASPVDTSVKFFHSGQIGAPVLTGAAGSMIALLDACLVNGFGIKTIDSLVVAGGEATITITGTHSAQVDTVILVAGVTNLTTLNGEQKVTAVTATTIKFATAAANGTATGTMTVKQAPAGWAKPYTGTNLAVYRSDDVTSNRRYARLADTATYNTRIIVYEAMTTVSAGTGPMPTTAQLSGGGYMIKSAVDWAPSVGSASTWAVFANGKRVLIYVAGGAAGGHTGGVLYGWGDFKSLKPGDVYNTFLSTTIEANSFYSALGHSQLSTAVWVQRLHTNAAGAVYAGAGMPFGVLHQEAGGLGWGTVPAAAGGGLLLAESMVWTGDGSAGFRGMLPGRWQTPQTVDPALIAHADIVPGSGATAGRRLFALRCAPHPSSATPGPGTFIDVTGPWD